MVRRVMAVGALCLAASAACGQGAGAGPSDGTVRLLTSAGSPEQALPTPFRTLPLPEAREQARAQGRLLIVMATADWCMPCKQMDRVTWVADDVRAWIDRRAVAIKVDVDRDVAHAPSLRAGALPTVIAFAPEGEIDRFVGFRSADDVRAWFDRLDRGETQAAEFARRLEGWGQGDASTRLALARDLVAAARFEQATPILVSLWNDEGVSDWGPASLGTLVEATSDAAGSDAASADALRGVLSAMRGVLTPESTSGTLQRWMALHEALGEHAGMLGWFDVTFADASWRGALGRIGPRLLEWLRDLDRWAQAGELEPDPAAFVAQSRTRLRAGMEQARAVGSDLALDAHRQQHRVELSRLHASLAAARREAEARAVGEALLEEDPSAASALELARWAVRAKVATPEVRGWIDRAASDPDLAERARNVREDLDRLGSP